MLYPSNDLRRGRRRLEEIEEISTSNLLYSVYESNVVNDMFCGYTPTEVKHNDK